jgi:hypothetical protein
MGSLNLGAGAATVTYAPGKPINVKRVIFVTTTAQATAGAAITFGVRNVDDTSSTTVGSFTTPAVMALNSVYKADVAGVSTTAVTPTGEHSQVAEVTTGRVDGYQTNLPGEIEVNPGQEFWVTSGGEGDTGVATVYIEYVEEGNNADRFDATDITVTFA